MKLIKCKKCGATVMTSDTLLTAMQDEYNALVKRAKHAKGADKNLIRQQMSHLSKMMVQVCHSSAETVNRKDEIYNQFYILKRYIIENRLIDFETLTRIQKEAREQTKKKIAEDEKKIAEQYGDFVNTFCNRSKADPTATEAMKGSGLK